MAARVEGEGNSPFAMGGGESHFIHVGMSGPVESIDIGATQ